jgi:hypothetical protein
MSKVFEDKLANLNFAIFFGYGNCKKSIFVVWGEGDFKTRTINIFP